MYNSFNLICQQVFLEASLQSNFGQEDSDQDSIGTHSEVENIMREALEAVEDSDTSEEEEFCEEEIFLFCYHCNFKTRKEKGIKVHIGRVHSQKCETCDEVYFSRKTRETHSIQNSSRKSW